MEEIPMYLLFHSTDSETAKINAKNTEILSCDALTYMEQKGYSTTDRLELPENQYLPFLEQ